MSTTYLAMTVAILLGVGLVVGIGALSLISGALNFLFVKPKISILKSKLGDSGLAFLCKWDQDAEPVIFDKVRIQLYNPFGTPTQVDITKEFDGSDVDFVRDIDMGENLKKILTAQGLDKATVEVEVSSSRSSVAHKQVFKGAKFVALRNEAEKTAEELAQKYEVKKTKPLYTLTERTFIAEPLPKAEKHIVIPTNPIFAGVLAGGGGGGGAAASGAAAENFSVAKVWIEPGCIVCDACAGIFPEVFEVTDSTCLIRPDAPLNDGLKIQDAAEACPVEVIKFTKAG